VEAEDPLAGYRVGDAPDEDAFEELLEREGVHADRSWTSGGPPVAVAGDAIYLTHEGTVYRVRRREVTAVGQTRSSDYRWMQWGAGLYLLALPLALVAGAGLGSLVAVLLMVTGGVLVTLGFLSKALLLQVEDERIPPFVVDHRKWKAIRASIEHWT
jgi:hypothetical protein